jgi:hypothetical protein
LKSLTIANTGTGNVIADNANLGNLVTANYFSGSGDLLSNIQASNITGTVANANYAIYSGNVINSTQSNITSVGTLTELTVSGNVIFTGANVSLGNVSNLHIIGGIPNQVLKTDGAGNLTWITPTTGTGNANVAGGSTQIQYNGGTNLAASANLTFDASTKTLAVDKIIANGSQLTNIAGNNITGTVASANVANISLYSNTTLATTGTYYPRLGNLTTGYLQEYANSNLSFDAATGTLTTTNITATNNSNANNITANNITAGNIIGTSVNVKATTTFSNTVTFGNLTTFQQTNDVINAKTQQSGIVEHDFNLGGVWYHSAPKGNITVNITNLPTTTGRIIVTPIIVAQNATGSAYVINALQLNGIAQTINWAGGILPVGTVNKIDVFSFTILRNNNTWTVLGDQITYG